ncbi:MAG: hypothetical protein KGJ87_09125 [Planctomycetota bacterium]|nr:hypothetical protein [Planctomycetota bacterium]
MPKRKGICEKMKIKQNTEKSEVQILAYGSKQQGMVFNESDICNIESAKSALQKLQKRGEVMNLGQITGSEVSELYKVTSSGMIALVKSLRN